MKRIPFPAVVWLVWILAHVALSFLVPRGIGREPLLPVWARLTLLCNEAVLTAALALGIGWIATRAAKLRPWIRTASRCAFAVLLVSFVALSWVTLWLSGQFLNWDGLQFMITNFSSVFRYSEAVLPAATLLGPVALVGVAIAAALLGPRWIARIPETWTVRLRVGALGLAGFLLVAGATGEIVVRAVEGRVGDPETGISHDRERLYRLFQYRRGGPFVHVLLRVFHRPTRVPHRAVTEAEIERRPRIPMPEYAARIDRSAVRPWNVVVIVVDSFRADHLTAGGSPRVVLPRVEALCDESRVFTDAVTNSSHTDFATPAIFSGQYPLRSADVYRYPKNPSYPRVMLYDVLKTLGYRVGIFSSQNEEWGQMTNYTLTESVDTFVHAKSPGNGELVAMVDDGVTVTKALDWMAGDSPYFLYLNLQNAHLPYAVPDGFPHRFGPEKVDFQITVGWYPREKTEIVKDIYADSLAYVDAQIGRVLDAVDRERTLLVVCADHGEAFYEHGFAAHASWVYDEVARVPLIVRAPGLSPARDPRPAQLIDVPSTVLALMGLPDHPSFQGENLTAAQPPGERSRYVVCVTPWVTQYAIVRGDYKLLYDTFSGETVLYHRWNDPGERRDLAAELPDRVADLLQRLGAWEQIQLDYYENPMRHAVEGPPVLRER